MVHILVRILILAVPFAIAATELSTWSAEAGYVMDPHESELRAMNLASSYLYIGGTLLASAATLALLRGRYHIGLRGGLLIFVAWVAIASASLTPDVLINGGWLLSMQPISLAAITSALTVGTAAGAAIGVIGTSFFLSKVLQEKGSMAPPDLNDA